MQNLQILQKHITERISNNREINLELFHAGFQYQKLRYMVLSFFRQAVAQLLFWIFLLPVQRRSSYFTLRSSNELKLGCASSFQPSKTPVPDSGCNEFPETDLANQSIFSRMLLEWKCSGSSKSSKISSILWRTESLRRNDSRNTVAEFRIYESSDSRASILSPASE
nr:hypothetical protein Iba_chr08cCG3090 [Ipomoea batatas]